MAEIYHVLNRGVDKRKIFLDDQDYLRAIHDLFEFNDEKPVNNLGYFFNNSNNSHNPHHPQYIDVGRRYIGGEREPRKLLVNIHAFCLMPNHYHMLLSPIVENGISLFIKKFNGGFAKYFNERYKRNGALFQGRYKRILVKDESHFVHLPYYIHLNPLDLKFPEWRNRKMKNTGAAVKFLEAYRWSSHIDYLGEKNFPSVTQRDFLLKIFSGSMGYKSKIENWLKDLEWGDNFQKISLE